MTNFQIVNGGQTTASLFNAQRNSKADLDGIHVQVKLTIIPPEEAEDIVPKISEYANTQNKVSAADFFSNHPFHLRIEEISRRLWAPSPTGNLRETRWYYERTRGQYANAQSNLTPARKKEFLAIHPRRQMFIKTDLAKFENSWGMMPHIVSLGAQKNFVKFAESVSKKWEKDNRHFNEFYFKKLIAKAILFRTIDRAIMKQSWYGGYKANIVTYTVAKFSQILGQKNMCIHFEQIWNKQSISQNMEEFLISMAETINSAIQIPPQGITNVTEWCKRESCWLRIQHIQQDIPEQLKHDLLTKDENKQKESNAKTIQDTDNNIQNQTYVVEKGSAFWNKILDWSEVHSIFSPKEIDILNAARKIPSKIPTERQSLKLMDIEQKALDDGFKL
ncbi:AIPR protein [Candidatus Venteria ishoeyi]|uniref:AIPR protein n=2 Tax=Candidatus Venteria ishoeyi TaxID=1899563 RepID=A0A1H6F4C2_9GAMM|nr:AIPR protein [Candidatus Venteria ishoeyi]